MNRSHNMAPRKNPSGGPKPDKLMRDALALELHQEIKLSTGEKIKKLRLVARSLVDNAIEGDTTAIKEVFDRIDGKMPTPHAGDKDNPIEQITRIVCENC
jgi:Family of unknown function (DUF5681)